MTGAQGFWGVAVVCPKYDVNIGSLWRSAQIMGASVLVLIDPGNRGPLHTERLMKGVSGTRKDFSFSGIPGLGQASDVLGATRQMPVMVVDGGSLRERFPTSRIVGVECPDVAEKRGRESTPIAQYGHYERAIYVMGAEDFGLRRVDMDECDDLVYIESDMPNSLNLACAGTVICADRYRKTANKRRA